MHNSYTTNNFNVRGNNFQTHLYRYDNPLLVAIGGYIYEMYAMIIANSFSRDEKGNEIINTYRIPLTGLQLEPWEAMDENVSDKQFIVFPADKQLTPKVFKNYIRYMREESDIKTGLKELKDNGLTVNIKDDVIKVEVIGFTEKVSLDTDWFYLILDVASDAWIKPDDMVDLCLLSQYLRKDIQFVASDEKDENDKKRADELTSLFERFKKYEFLTNGKVMNDGQYTYSNDLGRIVMTREEFLEKFPDSRKLITR